MERNYPIIDVHSHILPGVDDGARTTDEAVMLFEMAYQQGIHGMIATPHDTRHKRSIELETKAAELESIIRKRFPVFFMAIGEELYYHEELPQRLLEKTALTLAGSPYVLVEFDPSVPYTTMFRGIRRIQEVGFVPVVAHIERYECMKNENYLREMKSLGCHFQMNFTHVSGSWFSRDVRWCRKMLKDEMIWIMGTDLHRLDFRPPEIREALKWMDSHLEANYVKKILYDHAMQIIKYETKS